MEETRAGRRAAVGSDAVSDAVHRVLVAMDDRPPRWATMLPACSDSEARRIAEGVFTAARVLAVEPLQAKRK